MSEQVSQTSSGASGANQQDSSGVSGNTEVSTSQGQQDVVSYETHKKLLSEKKKLAERLDALEREQRQRQEEQLKSQNQFKELYERTLQEKEHLSKRVTDSDDRWNRAVKLDKFMNALGGKKIDPQYIELGVVNLDNIAFDPETGNVDLGTVQREVDRVSKQYPDIVKSPTPNVTMPSQPPQSPFLNNPNATLKSLSISERLALAAKELAQTQR